ncbi:MAG: hypothetical protein HC844_10475 [Tabrizicola sp.]|nr:hypothetical protein [Tabrizicola sp.]
MFDNILLIVLGMAGLSGLLTWLVAVRYGLFPAILLPLVAVFASAGMFWRSNGLSLQDGIGQVAGIFIFGLPILTGAVLAVLLRAMMLRKRGGNAD